MSSNTAARCGSGKDSAEELWPGLFQAAPADLAFLLNFYRRRMSLQWTNIMTHPEHTGKQVLVESPLHKPQKDVGRMHHSVPFEYVLHMFYPIRRPLAVWQQLLVNGSKSWRFDESPSGTSNCHPHPHDIAPGNVNRPVLPACLWFKASLLARVALEHLTLKRSPNGLWWAPVSRRCHLPNRC